jgi:acyl transferase domain-containing protein/acyl-CoA synthetase (AMP-forming)/AMP-acid ligase II/glyoxylase-like metal-dependent hydrolase (beta-lactamase superfamily II)/acyl carrier protein
LLRTCIPTKSASGLTTWIDLLQRLAAEKPEGLAYTFLTPGLAPGGGEGTSLSFRALDERARAIAARLQREGVKGAPGARALLLYPPGLEYIAGFFGCLYAGVVAVPAYPPDRTRLARTLPRIKAIAADANATLVLTTSAILDAGDLDAAHLELAGLTQVTTDDVSSSLADTWRDVGLTPDSVALLQYTSGSTSTPSGVILTHGNMLHNAAIQQRAWSLTPESVGVSWLPLYHDLGVISCLLQPVFTGFHTVMLSPADFIQKPLRWLQAIARFGGTFCGGPNFAFELCVQKTTEAERAALDLHTWETAFNGAEPIRPESLDRFADAFAVSGFKRSALYPCYGLAETNFVSGMRPGAGATVGRFEVAGLERGEVIVASDDATRADVKTRALVSCGEVPTAQTLAIVDPESTNACPPGRVGEVWISGASVGLGYWGRPEISDAVFRAKSAAFGDTEFLRTGDLGFVEGGHLYLTGRLKDLIIVRGANHYPQDIEHVVERSHAVMRAGCTAAFAIEHETGERVVVVQEVGSATPADLAAALDAARAAVLREHEIALQAIVLVKAGSIAKTTSGKIQRRACKAAFLEGTLDIVVEWRRGATSSPPARSAVSTPPSPSALAVAPTRSVVAIEAWLVANVSQQLKMDPRHIDVREPFASYGLDSLAATELSGALEAWLERRVEPTAVYEHPTIEALAKHLATGLALPSWAPPKPGRPERREAEEPIAIVGIACRFPGSDSPAAFWSLLRDGVDAVSEVPASRWNAARIFDADASQPGKTNSRWGGFLAQVDQFDPLFFGISPREARHMDPQQRLLLEIAWEALEDAGQVPDALRGSATGVFLGMTTEDYGHMQWNRPDAIDMYSATGTLSSVASGRISYVFDFRGPSLSIDTACSSSLVAIHYACQSLWNGEATMALAGGVNLMLTPENGISQTKLGALAADGKCKAFDASADGFVRGEGAGLVVLKRLSQAVADGDRVYAVIRGSAVNQDGRSNGLTAPNPQAQRAVLREAYRHAGVSPGAVQYIEAHGTGTPLGDPMELQALGRVLGTDRATDDVCAIGSVKTNIGHLESAAGIAGVLKTALALHHEELPSSLHFKHGNPLIAFEKLHLRVQDQAAAWPRGDKARIAGVSSFGIGGTNAHIVLAEAPEQLRARRSEPSRYALPLSARTHEALVALARAYAASLNVGALRETSLAAICYTAGARRGHLEHRLCVVGRDRAELVAKLTAFASGESAASVYVGTPRETTAPPNDLTPAATHDALAARYVSGHEVDFAALHGGVRDVVTLPSYAWQRTRHWLADLPVQTRETGATHPLLARHVQTTSRELLWEVDVTRDSHGFLQDHVLGGARVFPGLAYVEMVLAGANEALGEGAFEATDIELLAAMFVGDDDARVVQLSLVPDANGTGAAFRVHSRSRSASLKGATVAAWTLHAKGRVERVRDDVACEVLESTVADRCADAITGDAFYASLRAAGTEYGPRFQGVASIARRDGEALGEVRVPASLSSELGPYLFHPALLDACAQVLLATQPSMHPFMPVRIARIRLHARPVGTLRSHARVVSEGADDASSFRGDVRVYDGASLVAEIVGAEIQRLDRMQRTTAAPSASYDLVWNAKPTATAIPIARERATWLVVADRQGVGDALASRLIARGDSCIVVPSGEDGGEATRAALKRATVPGGAPLRTIVHLVSLDAAARTLTNEALLDARDRGCATLGTLARELVAIPDAPRMWAVTCGAQSVGAATAEVAAAQAPIWGFGRSLSVECPRVWGGLVDLDPAAASPAQATALLRSIDAADGEDQIALRGDARYVARLVRRSEAPMLASLTCRADGAYLITGGLGGLGLHVAKHLVDHGARELLLMGRTPLPPRALWDAADGDTAVRVAAIRAIEALGARVHVAACDVADEADLARALSAFADVTASPIRGVIHAAGVGRLSPVADLTTADLDADFRPKVLGASNLDRLLEDAPLDFFVLYSSLSAVLPSPLMAGYAASNAFLESLARNRRARGKTALCIHWGMWAEAGMAARAHANAPRRNEDWKAASLTNDEALSLQDRLLEENATVAIVTRTQWSDLARDPAFARLPLLSSLLGVTGAKASASPAASLASSVAAGPKLDKTALSSLPPAAQTDSLTAYLASIVEEVLALDAHSLDEKEPLDTVGYDSLAAVDVQMRIAKDLELDVPLLALLQRGSARELAARIARQLLTPVSIARTAPAPANVEPPKPVLRPIATPRDRSIAPREINASLSMYPARTPTLPPATHTNSYALGGREVVLVEPATPFESEQRAWIEWVRGLASSGRRPVAIFATHHHDDHIGGLDVLSRELDLPVWMHKETWSRVGGPEPKRLLEDGETIHLDGPTPESWSVLHTPGHAHGHLCLWNADTKTIIAGDMIASIGTILIAPGDGDLQTYLTQLDRLANLGAAWALPAHGPPVEAPTALFRQYIQDRETRERDVLRAVVGAGSKGGSAEKLVGVAYADAPPHTWPIGMLSLQTHLEKLRREGLVVESDGLYRACG